MKNLRLKDTSHCFYKHKQEEMLCCFSINALLSTKTIKNLSTGFPLRSFHIYVLSGLHETFQKTNATLNTYF